MPEPEDFVIWACASCGLVVPVEELTEEGAAGRGHVVSGSVPDLCGPVEKKSGVALIATERYRHFEVEGWTAEHDREHVDGELAGAAIAYSLRAIYQAREARGGRSYDARLDFPPTTFWPIGWGDDWKPSDDPIRNLVRAGSLIAAEIDRLLADG